MFVKLPSHVWYFGVAATDIWWVFIELLLFAARERDDSVSSTYDTFKPDKVQQRVKAGSLAVDDALKQQVQKRIDVNQQVGLSHTVITLMVSHVPTQN